MIITRFCRLMKSSNKIMIQSSCLLNFSFLQNRPRKFKLYFVNLMLLFFNPCCQLFVVLTITYFAQNISVELFYRQSLFLSHLMLTKTVIPRHGLVDVPRSLPSYRMFEEIRNVRFLHPTSAFHIMFGNQIII